MDSMVNKYTAGKRLRSADAYSPDGRHDKRPEYPTVVYTQILKQLYPDVPVVLGGIEASLRRLAHFDYWQHVLRRSILCDSGADMIVYGMGELPMTEVSATLRDFACRTGRDVSVQDFRTLFRQHSVKQTVMLYSYAEIPEGVKEDDVVLHSYAAVMASPQSRQRISSHRGRKQQTARLPVLFRKPEGRYVVVNARLFPPHDKPNMHPTALLICPTLVCPSQV